MSSGPIGIRMNNPVNIKRATAMGAAVDVDWRGLHPQQTNKTFVRFLEPVYGYRAAARILMNYGRRYHIRTMGGVIARWAPASENDPESYTALVYRFSGIDPFTEISLEEPATVTRLLSGMTVVEVGSEHPYSPAQVSDGVWLAWAKEQ